MGRYLLDTTILVDYFRGKAEAIQFLDDLHQRNDTLYVSTIVRSELYYGCRNLREKGELNAFFRGDYISSVPLSLEIMGKMSELRLCYGKGYECGLVDMLIAATAILKSATLLTLNIRHFRMIQDLSYKKPY